MDSTSPVRPPMLEQGPFESGKVLEPNPRPTDDGLGYGYSMTKCWRCNRSLTKDPTDKPSKMSFDLGSHNLNLVKLCYGRFKIANCPHSQSLLLMSFKRPSKLVQNRLSHRLRPLLQFWVCWLTILTINPMKMWRKPQRQCTNVTLVVFFCPFCFCLSELCILWAYKPYFHESS